VTHRCDILYHQAKEAALRDLPHLARGVMANLREHTLPDIRRAAAARDALRDPSYINTAQTLRERAGRFAQLFPPDSPMGDAREIEAVARLLRMRRAAGGSADLQDILVHRAAGQQSVRRLQRASKAWAQGNHVGSIVLDADRDALSRYPLLASHSGGIQQSLQERTKSLQRDHPVDADFLRRVGAKPVPQVIGTRLGGVVDEPHYLRDGLRHTLVGAPGGKMPPELAMGVGYRAGPVGFAIGASQPVLAHELGHATGLGGVVTGPLNTMGQGMRVPALKLPEEFRAQMRGQDIMRDWQRRGVASGLPAELAHLTPEQLKEHTIPLSTYADEATRHVANTALDLRDKARSVKDRLRRIVGKGSTE